MPAASSRCLTWFWRSRRRTFVVTLLFLTKLTR
nr:MAG TPA_asm: hypothetical protein [Caudoviricetes sp.]